MRELKFRVWTGNKMEYNVMVGFLGAFYVQGINPHDSACLSSFNTIYSKETPVMQFTGLKDSTGKDIYEGDIIFDGESSTKIMKKFFIEYNKDYGRFTAIGVGRESWTWVLDIRSTGKVVGNIFENLELLK